MPKVPTSPYRPVITFGIFRSSCTWVHTKLYHTWLPAPALSSYRTIFSSVQPDYLRSAAAKDSVERMVRGPFKKLARKEITINVVSCGPTTAALFLPKRAAEGLEDDREWWSIQPEWSTRGENWDDDVLVRTFLQLCIYSHRLSKDSMMDQGAVFIPTSRHSKAWLYGLDTVISSWLSTENGMNVPWAPNPWPATGFAVHSFARMISAAKDEGLAQNSRVQCASCCATTIV